MPVNVPFYQPRLPQFSSGSIVGLAGPDSGEALTRAVEGLNQQRQRKVENQRTAQQDTLAEELARAELQLAKDRANLERIKLGAAEQQRAFEKQRTTTQDTLSEELKRAELGISQRGVEQREAATEAMRRYHEGLLGTRRAETVRTLLDSINPATGAYFTIPEVEAFLEQLAPTAPAEPPHYEPEPASVGARLQLGQAKFEALRALLSRGVAPQQAVSIVNTRFSQSAPQGPTEPAQYEPAPSQLRSTTKPGIIGGRSMLGGQAKAPAAPAPTTPAAGVMPEPTADYWIQRIRALGGTAQDIEDFRRILATGDNELIEQALARLREP